jgi:monofunctional biosynthetic peptidoglycan transglycosylase
MYRDGEPIIYQYVSLDHVSRYMIAATIAHEDQELGTRAGAFHPEHLWARATAHLEGKPDPSGSTIPQQLAKNIFLYPDQNGFRKAVEAGLATELSYTLSDQRIMELYLNYAEFGPKLYGVCAASWYYFNTPPWHMTEYQAAQLMGVLPKPKAVERAKEGGIYLGPTANIEAWEYVNGAANVWVPRQIEGMGGWQAAVATIGITDTAADHADKRSNQDACSTMPQAVADRLRLESEG